MNIIKNWSSLGKKQRPSLQKPQSWSAKPLICFHHSSILLHDSIYGITGGISFVFRKIEKVNNAFSTTYVLPYLLKDRVSRHLQRNDWLYKILLWVHSDSDDFLNTMRQKLCKMGTAKDHLPFITCKVSAFLEVHSSRKWTAANVDQRDGKCCF